MGLSSSYERMESLIKSKRTPHALLILGEKGAGKRTFALHFAMALLCRDGLYPCFNCSFCKKAAGFNHPDIIYAGGNEKTSKIGVDEIRRLRAETSKVPQEGSRKVFIIEDAENLTTEAQNAFLKILEEPPDDTVFILTCNKQQALLETVVSRLTSLSLPIIDAGLKKEALKRLSPKSSDEEIELAAGVFSTVGKAFDVLKEGQVRDNFKKSLEAAELIKNKKRYQLLCIFSHYNSAKERESFKELLSLTLSVCLYYCKNNMGITCSRMDRINRAFCRSLVLLENNVSPLAAGAAVAERVCC